MMMQKPNTKVTASAAGAALGTILVLGAVWLGAEQPPAGFEGAVSIIGAFTAGYLIRERSS